MLGANDITTIINIIIIIVAILGIWDYNEFKGFLFL